jgi:hypothetical protein
MMVGTAFSSRSARPCRVASIQSIFLKRAAVPNVSCAPMRRILDPQCPILGARRLFGVFPYELTLAYVIFMGQLTKGRLLGRGTGSPSALIIAALYSVSAASFYKLGTH